MTARLDFLRLLFASLFGLLSWLGRKRSAGGESRRRTFEAQITAGRE